MHKKERYDLELGFAELLTKAAIVQTQTALRRNILVLVDRNFYLLPLVKSNMSKLNNSAYTPMGSRSTSGS